MTRYSDNFKRKAVEILVKDKSQSYSGLSRLLGVDASLLRYWYLAAGHSDRGYLNELGKIIIVKWLDENPQTSYTNASILIGVDRRSLYHWVAKYGTKRGFNLRKKYKLRFFKYLKHQQVRGVKGRMCKNCFFGSTYCNKLKIKLEEEFVHTEEAIQRAKDNFSPGKTCLDFSGKNFLP